MEYLDNPSRGCKINNSPYSPPADRDISLCADQEDSEKVDSVIIISECNLYDDLVL